MAVRVQTWAVRPEGWPEGAPLRIVILSDLHACRPWMGEDRILAIVDQAQALGGDLIALLGDYPGHIRLCPAVPPQVVASAFARLRAPLGVWSVFGNHDWRDTPGAASMEVPETAWHRAFADAGIACLENCSTRVSTGGREVALAGLASQRAISRDRGVAHDGHDDLDAALAGVPEEMPTVLLAHEPDIFAQLPGHVDLMLAGHTHGGQIRFFGRPWVVPSRYGTRYAYGHMVEAGRHLVVSGGLGCSGVPIRWRMPPEITVVEVG